MDYLYILILLIAVGALGWRLGSRGGRKRSESESGTLASSNVSGNASHEPTQATQSDAAAKRIPLGSVYLAFVTVVTVLKLFAFLASQTKFGSPELSAAGVALHLAGLIGETIGQSLWVFIWPVLYRLFLKVTRKQYSFNFEAILLATFTLLVVLSVAGSN
jgi:hypothetical protein